MTNSASTTTTKPHKGRIEDWGRWPAPGCGLGYVIIGTAAGHPDFDGEQIRTSWVEKHDEATGEIETRNSRYTLVGDAK